MIHNKETKPEYNTIGVDFAGKESKSVTYINAEFVKDLLPYDFLPDKPLEHRLSKYIESLRGVQDDYMNLICRYNVLADSFCETKFKEEYPLTPKEAFNE